MMPRAALLTKRGLKYEVESAAGAHEETSSDEGTDSEAEGPAAQAVQYKYIVKKIGVKCD